MDSVKEHLKVLGKLNIAAFSLMMLANKAVSALSLSKNILKPGTGHYYKWKYGDVFYRKIGHGSPLLLIHDTDPEQSGYVWNEVADQFSDKTIYIVDLPGCGRSVKNRMVYTNYFYVLFLRDFIRHVIRQKTDILADGYSSSFAIAAAAMDSRIIRHIIAVNPCSFGKLSRTESSRSKFGKLMLELPVIGTSLYNIETSRRHIDYRFTEDILYNPFHKNDRYVDAFYEGAHYHEEKGKYLLASIKGLYMTVNIKTSLRKVGKNVSILYGAGCEHGNDIADEYKGLCSQISIGTIPKAKHLPMIECPKAFLHGYNLITAQWK